MEAVKFLKEEKRFLNSDTDWEDIKGLERAEHYQNYAPEEQVDIIEQWSKEHSFKTRQSEFLKFFPSAKRHDYYTNVLEIRPCDIDEEWEKEHCKEYRAVNSCTNCRRDYWNGEVK